LPVVPAGSGAAMIRLAGVHRDEVLSVAMSLIKEMEQILSDQVAVECPACDEKGSWIPGKSVIPRPRFFHAPDCVIRKARIFIGREE
jgi:hypothetical protein